MRSTIHPQFYETFNLAVRDYLKGNWKSSCEYLRRIANDLCPDDGPTSMLLELMTEHKMIAPADWSGARIDH